IRHHAIPTQRDSCHAGDNLRGGDCAGVTVRRRFGDRSLAMQNPYRNGTFATIPGGPWNLPTLFVAAMLCSARWVTHGRSARGPNNDQGKANMAKKKRAVKKAKRKTAKRKKKR